MQQSVSSPTQWLQGTAGLDLVWGHARFTGSDAVEVGGQAVSAPKLFINVGGRPVDAGRHRRGVRGWPTGSVAVSLVG